MDELDTIIRDFIEASKRGAQKEQAEKLVKPLAKALRKAFWAQGALFMKKLNKYAPKFSEKYSDENPFVRYARKLATPIKEVISASDWMSIWDEVALATLALFAEPIDKAVAQALLVGGLATIAQLGVDINFDLDNPRAKAYLEEYGAKLVAGVNETTKGYIQTLMVQAAEEGWSYQKTAQELMARFDEFAIGMPQAHIDSRAHLIAVTEIGNAYSEGNLQIAMDLKAAGLTVEKFWSTVGDGLVSDGCKENEAAGWIGIDEMFPSGDQRPLRFPGCRCDLLTQVVKSGK